MSENDKKDQSINDDDKLHINDGKKRSMTDTIREITEREQRAELEEESRRAAYKAEKERAAREAYAKKLAEERVELMKLKAGIISEEDIPREEEPVKVYTTWQKIGNFFYHNKLYIIIITIITLLAAFLIYDYATKVNPDVSIMIIATDDEFYYRAEDIKAMLEPYCQDFNGDKKVSLRVSYLPAVIDENTNSASLYNSQADQTKLMAEFHAGDSIIVIADEFTCEFLGIDGGTLVDMKEIYPDDENAQKLGYMLNGTDFAKDMEYPDLADNLFIGFRVPTAGVGINEEKFIANYENALALWDNYLNKNVVNEAALTEVSE